MKHETETHRLIDLLMAGEISPAEQRRLKTLLSTADLDEELIVYREMMEWMDRPMNEPSEEELAEIQTAALPEEKSRRIWPLSRVAAMLALIICIGALAGTITYRVVNHLTNEPSSAPATDEKPTASAAIQPKEKSADDAPEPKDEVRLSEALAFDNQSLAEIGSKITEIYGCKINFADEQSADLRLYFTVPKGSTLADFVRIIDQYDALEASLTDSIVTIKREEAGK